MFIPPPECVRLRVNHRVVSTWMGRGYIFCTQETGCYAGTQQHVALTHASDTRGYFAVAFDAAAVSCS